MEALFANPIEQTMLDCDHFTLLRGEAGARLGAILNAALAPAAIVDAASAIVVDLIHEILPDVPVAAITPDRSMDELGATSMDRVEVATRAMEALGITVPHRELSGVASIGALIAVLRRHAGHG